MLHMQAQLTALGGVSVVADAYDHVRFYRHSSILTFGLRTSPVAAILETAVHPLRDDRLELGRSLLPDALTGLENIQTRIRQSFAEKPRVSMMRARSAQETSR